MTQPDPFEPEHARQDSTRHFIEVLLRAGMISMTAIIPDGPTATRTFSFGEEDEATGWLADQAGRRKNVYYQLNPSRSRLSSKATKRDIAHVVGFHVDCDPEGAAKAPGLEREKWKAAKLGEMRTIDPPPTVVVDSGNGLQAIWLLNAPLTDAAQAEAINRGIAKVLGAQPGTHDVSRLLRLPGFANIPGKAKREAGYQITQATLMIFERKRSYPLEAFLRYSDEKATNSTDAEFALEPLVEGRTSGSRDLISKKLDGKLPTSRIQRNWLSALQAIEPSSLIGIDLERVAPDLAIIAHEGFDNPFVSEPLREKRDHSALALWFAAVGLKVGHSIEHIAACLFQDVFAVGAHIRKDGPADWRKVIRTITAAIVEMPHNDCLLAELNASHSVVRVGGKTMVARFYFDPEMKRDTLELMSFAAFRDYHRTVRVVWKIGEKTHSKPLGDWWLDHSLRRTHEGLTLDPTGSPLGYLNLWRGFGVEARHGSCRKIIRHIWQVLARRDHVAFRYIMKWLAWAVQNPGRQAEVALVFIGGRGSGKGTLGRAMVRLFGPHGIQIFSSNLFTGRFNGHLHNACLLFADEATQPENQHAVGRLKGLITEDTMPVERKGIDAFSVRNRLKVIIATNDHWAVPAGEDERRFAVFSVSEAQKQSKQYFEALNAELDGAGLPALLDFLQSVNLDGWHPRYDIPSNGDLAAQKELTLSGAAKVIHYCLKEGELPGAVKIGGPAVVATEQLSMFARSRFPGERVTANSISDVMRKLGFPKAPRSGSQRGWLLPTLHEARALWDKMQFRVAWDETTEWQCVEPTLFGSGSPNQGKF